MSGRDPGAEVAAIWNELGGWWDDYIGVEGNEFHREVVGPATEALLGIRRGERVLDVACGNGQFSRRLAELGAEVVAFDFSETFIERARRHTTQTTVEYQVADATDEEQLAALGASGSFDAAVANMALMDMSELRPLFRGLARLIRPGARFVFTLLHPCFGYPLAAQGNRSQRVAGVLNRGVDFAMRLFVRVFPSRRRLRLVRAVEPYLAARQSLGYLRPAARRGFGIIGQPVLHWYFHRPLEVLLAPAFEAGFVVDGLSEPPMPGQPGRAGLLAVRVRLPAQPT